MFTRLNAFAALPMRAVIPLLTGAGGIVVLALFTHLHWRDALDDIEQQARRDVAVIMSNLHASLSYLFENEDIAGVRTVLTHQGYHRHMKHLFLVDEAGAVIAGNAVGPLGSSLERIAPDLARILKPCQESDTVRVNSRETVVLGCSAINVPAQRPQGLRTVYVVGAYDLSALKTRAQERVRRQIGAVWLLVAAGFTVMLLLVRRALDRRRIAQVVAATEKIAAGDLRARVAQPGGDELAVIGRAVDRMAAELENARRRLLRAHEGMEQRVAIRTAELAEANQMLQREVEVRKQAEEEAKREGTWFRSVIQTTQDGVVAVDGRGKIILFNPAAERIFGYTASDILGRDLDQLMPAWPAFQRPSAGGRESDRAGAPLEGARPETARRINGESFPVEVSVAEVSADGGVHYVAFVRDVSETHRLQDQLIETERLAAIGTTSAKIGHELANPLNGIYLTIQLLEQRLARELAGADVMQKLGKIRDEIARLNHLVQQFRTISRREKYEFRRFCVAEWIDDVLTMQQPVCAAAGVEIVREVAGDVTTVRADRRKLTQALLNLIKNSIEATSARGKIVLRARTEAKTLIVEVSDSGSGIPPEIDLFQPFSTTKAHGTGIGLVVVRQIVTAHRGTVAYSTQPGEGSTFTITLPLA